MSCCCPESFQAWRSNHSAAVKSPSAMAALAYPDRIGQRRKGDAPRYVLSGGKGVVLDSADPLANAPFLVVIDTDGNPREAKVRMATQILERDIRDLFADQINWVETCAWSKRERRVVSRRQERFGAITLDDLKRVAAELYDADALTIVATGDPVGDLGALRDN